MIVAVSASPDDVFHDMSRDIREPIITAGVAEGEPGVIQAELIQDRRLKIVDVDRVGSDGQPVIVGGAVNHSGLDAAARHPG